MQSVLLSSQNMSAISNSLTIYQLIFRIQQHIVSKSRSWVQVAGVSC